MKYRRRTYVQIRRESKEFDGKSSSQLLKEFLRISNSSSNNADTSNKESADGESMALQAEYLKTINMRLKLRFNLAIESINKRSSLLESNRNENNDKSKDDKLEFDKELSLSLRPLSITLILNLIQSQSNILRFLSMRLIVYLSHFPEYFEQFQLLNINCYVIRLIDLDSSNDETAMAIELIRFTNQFYPHVINEAHFFCLMSTLENYNNKLNTYILETLLELICKHPRLACRLRVFNDLINFVVNSFNENDFCVELIMQCLIRIMDDKENRQLLNPNDLFSYIIAPFIDIDYVPLISTQLSGNVSNNNDTYNNRTSIRPDAQPKKNSFNEENFKIESVLNSCFVALNAIFNNFQGIFCFSVNNGSNISTLLSPLSWFLQSKKRDCLLKRHYNNYGLTGGTIGSNSDNIPSQSTNSYYLDPKLLDKDELTILRQMLILNTLINLIYKIFNVDQINMKNLIDKARKSSTNSANYSFEASLEEDFINAECKELFDLIDKTCTLQQLNSNIEEEKQHHLNVHSTSPNLKSCLKAFLYKTFIEQNLFESLLNLYFGLPVSFFKYDFKQNNLNSMFQSLSFKSLHLFAELYYGANELLFNEYFIDDFERQNLNFNGSCKTTKESSPYNINHSVYNHIKKFNLVTYLKELNDLEREKEVIIYLTEFNKSKESLKNGINTHTDILSRLSLYSHQFLANSAFFCSKKYENTEVEIYDSFKNKNERISLNAMEIRESNSLLDFVSNIINVNDNPSENILSSLKLISSPSRREKQRKDSKKKLSEVEKRIHEQIDATVVLQTDSNIVYRNKQQLWNWSEILKLFETFLLTSSSINCKFLPTKDALIFEANANSKIFNESSSKLSKFIKKFAEYFSIPTSSAYITTDASNLSSSPSSSSSTKTLTLTNHFARHDSFKAFTSYQPQSNNTNQTQQATSNSYLSDQILCSGCYLIDFILSQFSMKNLTERSADGNNKYSKYEFLLVQLVQHMKNYIANEYSVNTDIVIYNNFSTINTTDNSARSSFLSSNSLYNKNLNKDSLLAYYILFIGHLTSSDKGDKLLEAFKIYDLLMKIIELYKDLALMKLIISTFNFYISFQAQSIIKKCLCISYSSFSSKEHANEYRQFKVYALKMIANVFKANTPKFEVFFLNVMTKSLIISEEWTTNSQLNQNELYAININNQIVIDFSVTLIEYFINIRPDLVDSFILSRNTDSQRIESLRNLLLNDKNLKKLQNSKILKTKLRFLFFRFQLCDVNLKKMSMLQMEKIYDEWDSKNMDVKYYQMIERNCFEANCINENYVNEYEENINYENNDEEFADGYYDEIVVDDTNENYTCNHNIKLYRRINDVSKNDFKYLADKAHIYLPFHINTSIIRYQKFLDNNFYLNDKFNQKIINYISAIKHEATTFNLKNNKKLKAALWSISTLCISESGFKFISTLNLKNKFFANLFEFATWFVKISEDHPNLSIRSACFYCINLITRSSTGANLFGKLGWHTFQPNKQTQVKAFYSTLCSMSNEEYDFSVFSSFDSAIILYNINRAQSKVKLKQIFRLNCDLSTYEKDFLSDQMKIDYLNKPDSEFFKQYDASKMGIFFDSTCLPSCANLMSIEESFNVDINNYFYFEGISPISNCQNSSCFYCYLSKNKLLSHIDEIKDETNKIKTKIITLVNQLTPSINLDMKMHALSKLKSLHPNEFTICLHALITNQLLSKCKLKNSMRKFIQELFINMSLNVFVSYE